MYTHGNRWIPSVISAFYSPMPWRIPTTRIDPKREYTPSEGAALLGVTVETIKSYCRNKKLKAYRVGPKKEWRIRGSEAKKLRDKWKQNRDGD